MINPGIPTYGPIVIKIGGSTLDDHERDDSLWTTLHEFHASRPAGAGLILVHGGGKAVDRHLGRLGLTSERRAGLRVTPDEHIDEVVAVLAGVVNKKLLGRLVARGARPIGLSLGDGPIVRVIRQTDPDIGRVGMIAGGDGGPLITLLDAGYLPVVSSIGIDAEGHTLNVNADDAAAGIAVALHAQSLVLLTDVPGIRDASNTVRSRLTGAEISSMIDAGVLTGGMIPKARAAVAVARELHNPVVILSGENPQHLVRWLRGEEIGTSISA